MTAAQRVMLFSLFARLAKLRCWGVAQRELERDGITQEVFREKRSWSTFNDRDVDMMKAHLNALLDPDSLNAQINEIDAEAKGERRRLIYKIEQVMRRNGFSESYVRELCRSFYDTAEWRDLPLDRLTNIRDTLNSRAYAKKRRSSPAPVDEPF